MTSGELCGLLREKAQVYEDHPDYPWLLSEHRPYGLGHLMAYELRSAADLIEWIQNRESERGGQTIHPEPAPDAGPSRSDTSDEFGSAPGGATPQ